MIHQEAHSLKFPGAHLFLRHYLLIRYRQVDAAEWEDKNCTGNAFQGQGGSTPHVQQVRRGSAVPDDMGNLQLGDAWCTFVARNVLRNRKERKGLDIGQGAKPKLAEEFSARFGKGHIK